MKFKVNNINCINCANTIKNALQDEFGDIKVSVEEKTVELNLNENDIEKFKSELDDLGFEVVAKID